MNKYKTVPYPVSSQDGTNITRVVHLPIPCICPVCGKGGEPTFIEAISFEDRAFALYFCERDNCKTGFIANYIFNLDIRKNIYTASLQSCHPQMSHIEKADIPDRVSSFSKRFTKVCNQAYMAHQIGLYEISGPGFRKALEILVKDYCLKELGCDQTELNKIFLQPCIDKYIPDSTLKTILKAAVENGNDETHYNRKYEASDIEFLVELFSQAIELFDGLLAEKEAKAFLASKKTL